MGNLIHECNESGVHRLTIDRSEVHNAFDDALINELAQQLRECACEEPRVLILQSTGKSFSAGADLNWMKRSATYSKEENRADAYALAQMLNLLNTFPLSLIHI